VDFAGTQFFAMSLRGVVEGRLEDRKAFTPASTVHVGHGGVTTFMCRAVICFTAGGGGHFTCFVRCGKHWFYHDDVPKRGETCSGPWDSLDDIAQCTDDTYRVPLVQRAFMVRAGDGCGDALLVQRLLYSGAGLCVARSLCAALVAFNSLCLPSLAHAVIFCLLRAHCTSPTFRMLRRLCIARRERPR
jgi:hypothetical protein